MYNRLVKTIFLTIAFVLVSALNTFADDIAPPCSYITFSADRSHAFVMLAPKSEYECGSSSDDTVGIGLRKRFASSGMYEKGDPARLKWAVSADWFAYKVLVPNDGESIVRMGPWASNFSDEAFSFIRNGSIVRTVKISELVKDESAVERTVSHFFWTKNYGLTSDGSTFFVDTLDGGSYRFDVKTGEMTSSTPGKPAANASPAKDGSKGTCTFALFFIAAFAAFRRKRS
jgi:hypothetical protein